MFVTDCGLETVRCLRCVVWRLLLCVEFVVGRLSAGSVYVICNGARCLLNAVCGFVFGV